MVVLARIVFTAALVYGFFQAGGNARANAAQGDIANAGWLAFCVVMGIGAALSWAPLIAGRIADPLTGPLVSGTYIEPTHWLMKFVRWADNRHHRRLARWLCFIEGVRRPWLPTQFLIGMKNAAPGSWLEKAFAREVFRFNHTEHCLKAAEVLRRHGVTPPPHGHGAIDLVLQSVERGAAPEKPALPVPASEPPPMKRNPRIQIFDPAASPPAPPPSPGPPQEG